MVVLAEISSITQPVCFDELNNKPSFIFNVIHLCNCITYKVFIAKLLHNICIINYCFDIFRL